MASAIQTYDLFVTSVDKFGPLLKIWGQTDRQTSLYIEQVLLEMLKQFDQQTYVKPVNNNIHVGLMCCAKYKDGIYYRAQIRNINPNGRIEVRFIDYGNIELIQIENIRLFDEKTLRLSTIPPQASEFILACVMHANNDWDEQSLTFVHQEVAYTELKTIVIHNIHNLKLVKVLYRDTDLATYLTMKGLTVPLQLETQDMYIRNLTTPHLMAQKYKVPELLSYKTTTLPPESEHMVYVSYVEDGPLVFSVQLQSMEATLEKLMADINRLQLEPLTEPPIPGHPCMARCMEDNTVCRAVVVSFVGDKCKTYYVDFGNTDVLPLSNIYQIPPSYMLPRAMSMRFTLADLKDLNITNEMKCAFKDFVTNKLLKLKVKVEDSPLIQYCELYDNDKNIADILYDKPHQYRILSLNKGQKSNVIVSYIEGCKKFFVQLKECTESLNSLMLALAATSESSSPLTDLKPGLPCCAFYSGDNQWYRAQIISINSGNVTVKYVDYGNVETIPSVSIHKIDPKFVDILPAQAIECCLYGYQNTLFNSEIENIFESLTLECEFSMKVKSKHNNVLLVDLFDSSCNNVAALLIEKLAAQKSMTSLPSQQIATALMNDTVENNDDKISWRNQENNNKTWRQNSEEKPKNDKWKNQNDNKSWRNDDNKWKNQDGEKSWKDGEKSWRGEEKSWRGEDKKNWRSNDDNARCMSVSNRLAQFRKLSNKKKREKNQWNDDSGGRGDTWDNKPKRQDRPRSRGDSWNDKKPFNKQNSWNDDPNRKKFNRNESEPRRKDSFDSQGSDRRKFQDENRKPKKNWGENDGKSFQAKKDFSSPKREKKQTVQQPLAELNEPFPYHQIELGAQENVAISWFYNPQNFFIQCLSQQQTFRDMMVQIQDAYTSDKYPLSSIPIGSSVIAEFAEDSILYRAVVLKQKGSKYKVQYVDFGNIGMVDQSKIYQVEKRFMSLPIQGIRCCLENIKPVGDNWEVNENIDKLFSKDNFTCVFDGVIDDMYMVQLWDGEKDLRMQLIEEGFAMDSLSFQMDGEPVDVNILLGQTLRIHLCYIENMEKFFIQIDPKKMAQIDLVMNKLTENEKALQVLSPEYIQPETNCLFKSETKWYRGTVIDIQNQESITIICPDNGRQFNVKPTQIYSLPSELCVYWYQSFECGLNNLTNDSCRLIGDEDFKNNYENKDLIIYVDNVDNRRLLVTLYDLNGQKLELFDSDEEAFPTVEKICPLPIFNSTPTIYISHIDTATSFYIQLAKDTDTITELLQKLYEFYETNEESIDITDLSVDMFCCAKSEDGSWYRAKLVKIEDDTVTVHYIDYGNSETVPKTNLKVLDERFCDLHELALNVSLGLTETGPEFKEKFTSMTQDKELMSVVYFENGWIVEVFDGDVNVNKVMIESGLVKEMVVEVLEAIPEEKRAGIIVTHCDSPSEFYVQLISNSDEVGRLQDELNSKIDDLPKLVNVDIGSLCAAKYMFDEQWYRAEVLDTDDDITSLRFVDFGNTDVIDNNAGLTKQLPPELLSIGRYAKKCSLNIRPLKHEWSPEASAVFEMAIHDKVLYSDIVYQDGKNNTYVELYDGNGHNIGDTLISMNYAEKITRDVEDDIANNTGFVSHINTISEFWIQLESSVADLEMISERLTEVESFPDLQDLSPGILCAALYPEDQLWYRGRILSNTVAGIEVLFIDYGNSSTALKLKVLPEDLAHMPALAQKCCLNKPSNITEWSDDATVNFHEISEEGATIFTIKKLSPGETHIVELFIDGCNIVEQLLQTRLTPIGESIDSLQETVTDYVPITNDQIENENQEVNDQTINNLVENINEGDDKIISSEDTKTMISDSKIESVSNEDKSSVKIEKESSNESSLKEEIESSKDDNDSSSKEEKESSNDDNESSLKEEIESSKDDNESSLKEEMETSKDDNDLSTKEEKEPSLKEEKELSLKEEMESSSKEEKESPSKEEKESPSKEEKELSSKDDKINSTPNEDKIDSSSNEDKAESSSNENKVESTSDKNKIETFPDENKIELSSGENKIESSPDENKIESSSGENKVVSPSEDIDLSLKNVDNQVKDVTETNLGSNESTEKPRSTDEVVINNFLNKILAECKRQERDQSNLETIREKLIEFNREIVRFVDSKKSEESASNYINLINIGLSKRDLVLVVESNRYESHPSNIYVNVRRNIDIGELCNRIFMLIIKDDVGGNKVFTRNNEMDSFSTDGLVYSGSESSSNEEFFETDDFKIKTPSDLPEVNFNINNYEIKFKQEHIVEKEQIKDAIDKIDRILKNKKIDKIKYRDDRDDREEVEEKLVKISEISDEIGCVGPVDFMEKFDDVQQRLGEMKTILNQMENKHKESEPSVSEVLDAEGNVSRFTFVKNILGDPKEIKKYFDDFSDTLETNDPKPSSTNASINTSVQNILTDPKPSDDSIDSIHTSIRNMLTDLKTTEKSLDDSITSSTRNILIDPKTTEKLIDDSLTSLTRNILTDPKRSEKSLDDSINSSMRNILTDPKISNKSLTDSITSSMRNILTDPKTSQKSLDDSITSSTRNILTDVKTSEKSLDDSTASFMLSDCKDVIRDHPIQNNLLSGDKIITTIKYDIEDGLNQYGFIVQEEILIKNGEIVYNQEIVHNDNEKKEIKFDQENISDLNQTIRSDIEIKKETVNKTTSMNMDKIVTEQTVNKTTSTNMKDRIDKKYIKQIDDVTKKQKIDKNIQKTVVGITKKIEEIIQPQEIKKITEDVILKSNEVILKNTEEILKANEEVLNILAKPMLNVDIKDITRENKGNKKEIFNEQIYTLEKQIGDIYQKSHDEDTFEETYADNVENDNDQKNDAHNEDIDDRFQETSSVNVENKNDQNDGHNNKIDDRFQETSSVNVDNKNDNNQNDGRNDEIDNRFHETSPVKIENDNITIATNQKTDLDNKIDERSEDLIESEEFNEAYSSVNIETGDDNVTIETSQKTDESNEENDQINEVSSSANIEIGSNQIIEERNDENDQFNDEIGNDNVPIETNRKINEDNEIFVESVEIVSSTNDESNIVVQEFLNTEDEKNLGIDENELINKERLINEEIIKLAISKSTVNEEINENNKPMGDEILNKKPMDDEMLCNKSSVDDEILHNQRDDDEILRNQPSVDDENLHKKSMDDDDMSNEPLVDEGLNDGIFGVALTKIVIPNIEIDLTRKDLVINEEISTTYNLNQPTNESSEPSQPVPDSLETSISSKDLQSNDSLATSSSYVKTVNKSILRNNEILSDTSSMKKRVRIAPVVFIQTENEIEIKGVGDRINEVVINEEIEIDGIIDNEEIDIDEDVDLDGFDYYAEDRNTNNCGDGVNRDDEIVEDTVDNKRVENENDEVESNDNLSINELKALGINVNSIEFVSDLININVSIEPKELDESEKTLMKILLSETKELADETKDLCDTTKSLCTEMKDLCKEIGNNELKEIFGESEDTKPDDLKESLNNETVCNKTEELKPVEDIKPKIKSPNRNRSPVKNNGESKPVEDIKPKIKSPNRNRSLIKNNEESKPVKDVEPKNKSPNRNRSPVKNNKESKPVEYIKSKVNSPNRNRSPVKNNKESKPIEDIKSKIKSPSPIRSPLKNNDDRIVPGWLSRGSIEISVDDLPAKKCIKTSTDDLVVSSRGIETSTDDLAIFRGIETSTDDLFSLPGCIQTTTDPSLFLSEISKRLQNTMLEKYLYTVDELNKIETELVNLIEIQQPPNSQLTYVLDMIEQINDPKLNEFVMKVLSNRLFDENITDPIQIINQNRYIIGDIKNYLVDRIVDDSKIDEFFKNIDEGPKENDFDKSESNCSFYSAITTIEDDSEIGVENKNDGDVCQNVESSDDCGECQY